MNLTKKVATDRLSYAIGDLAGRRALLIAEAGIDTNRAELLGNTLNSIAKAEGVLHIRSHVASLINQDATADRAIRSAGGLLQNGPDDRWSGRGNDLRRSRYDGMLDELRDLTMLYTDD